MLPIFLFEFTWKTIWLFAYGLPQWLAGGGASGLDADLLAIGNGPILFGLVIPWDHVWRCYVWARAERWGAIVGLQSWWKQRRTARKPE